MTIKPYPSDIVLLGTLTVSLAMFAVPQFFFIRLSLYQSLGMGRIGGWVGLGNYGTLVADRFALAVMVRTVWLSSIAALTALTIAAPTAYWLTRLKSRWLGILIVALLLSSFVSSVVKVLGIELLLGSNGIVVAAINALTLGFWRPQLLYNDFGVTVGLLQYILPLLVLLLFGVFQNIPVSLEEAALVHGASDLRMFRRVLLPEASRGLLASALIGFNMNMGAFTSPALLGGGKVLTIAVLIERRITLDMNYPGAAALSVLLTVVVIIINVLAGRLVIRRRHGARRSA